VDPAGADRVARIGNRLKAFGGTQVEVPSHSMALTTLPLASTSA
jgi:hypothetical protein